MRIFLYKKCSGCKNIIKAIMEDGKIIHLEGARPYRVFKPSNQRFTFLYTESNKTVACQFDSRDNPEAKCNTYMLIRSFKEITT